MKIPNDARPDVVASSDPERTVLNSLLLEIESDQARLVATDGRILLLLPVEVSPEDTPGLVPKEAIALAADPARRTEEVCDDMGNCGDVTGPIELTCGDSSVVISSTLSVARPHLKYPKYQAVLDAVPSTPPLAVIGLNAELLAKVQRGMGAQSLKIEVFGPDKAVRVTPTPGIGGHAVPNASGLVMPVRLD